MEGGIDYFDQLLSGSGGNENTSSSNATTWECVNSTRFGLWHGAASSVTVISAILSIFGCLLILFTYIMWKDVRKSTARAILFFLAIADLFSAIGYLVSAVTYRTLDTRSYERFCDVLSFWTTYFPMASYLWTAHFAIYYFVVLVLKKDKWRKKLMLVFHLTSWLIPLAICVPAVATGWLGTSQHTLSPAWCFVSDKNFYNQSTNNFEYLKDLYFFMEFICGKLWEVLTYTTATGCFVLIITCNRCRWNKFYSNSYASKRISEAMAQMDIKLLFIPILFVFIKIWGTIRFCLSVLPNCQSWIPLNGTTDRMEGFCIKDHCAFVYSPFLIMMQAICDPLQGFGNVVLFVFLSKVLCFRLLDCTRRLVCSVCCCCCYWGSEKRQDLELLEDKRPLVRIIKKKKLSNNGITISDHYRNSIYKGRKELLLYGTTTTEEGWELVQETGKV